MKTIKFEDIDKDLKELDFFNEIWDYQLITHEHEYNIIDTQLSMTDSDFLVFDYKIKLNELIILWTNKAIEYMTNEYLETISIFMLEESDYELKRQHLMKLNKILEKYTKIIYKLSISGDTIVETPDFTLAFNMFANLSMCGDLPILEKAYYTINEHNGYGDLIKTMVIEGGRK